MSDQEGKHVFVSYVREDSEAVDSLCAVLEGAQIPYWRDRTALGPGDAWKAKIRAAIKDESLVFLACFSDNSRAKKKSHMNEELTLAVEEFRQRPPGRIWLIPVRFDVGDVPDWDLGAGRVLSDLNYSDLFGKEHMVQAARLVTTINRLMGEKRPDTATALAAVEQATAADRTDLLKRLTKEMLLEPTRRIELDDLISQEVRRVLAVLKDEDRVAGPLIGTNEEKIVRIAEEAQSIWNLVAPFCASLHVAGRWGAPELLTPWATGIRSFVAASNVVTAGIEPFLKLRQLPGMVSIMTAALSCVASGNWLNLKTLVVDQYVRDRYEQKPLAILETTDPYRPFGDTDWVANTLARATTTSRDLDDSLKDFTERRQRKYAAPVAEWLHNVLRPIVADQLPDADSYSPEFDQAEIVLGVLAQDMANVRARDNSDGRSWVRSRWFARSVSQAGRGYRNPVADLVHEFDTQGVQWGPLRSGLFGGDEARARDALDKFQAEFDRIVTRRAFD